MYSFLRQILFSLQPELAHNISLKLLRYIPKNFFHQPKIQPIHCMGIDFPHRLGLAAGFDVSGEHLDHLAKIGFAFIELGTVTPKPQVGNPKPRIFRLSSEKALINRMGFNNPGVDVLVGNIIKSDYQGVIGINIGKNKDTSLNNAIEDYLYCLSRAYKHASYITINISSPNTPELRQLQQVDYFASLVRSLREEQLRLADTYKRYVPLAIKISPDETDDVLQNMAQVILSNKIDAIIATNTTCKREAIHLHEHAKQAGGLSGKPLFKSSTHCLKTLHEIVGDDVVLVGVGGIDGPDTAGEKISSGASLLQVYTGMIYEGPRIIDITQNI
ncbi:MAG: quinone-dependent dihydroorotate dehydrogenase [Legionellaceae bacterium]|nr:quinone-dependent dihydroorotate dehydrogenase [Legionellaceae bacterium]